MKAMKHLLSTGVLGALLTIGVSANANHHSLHSNISRLFEALNYVVEANELCDAGSHSYAASRLRIASYRVRIVLADVKYEPGLEKAAEALTVTNDKILDPSLTPREKVDIGLDCLAVALKVLIRRDAYYVTPTRTALTYLRLAKSLTGAFVFGPVESVLREAARTLRPVSCPITSSAYRKAVEAIHVAIDKIQDGSLRPDEKQFFAYDCIAVAVRQLQNLP